MPQNPVRAGAATATAAQIKHSVDFGGRKHADGYCSPLENCSACHGNALQGGSHGEPSCTSCHGTFWTDPNCGKLSGIHTLAIKGILHGPNPCKPQGVCTPCHGSSLEGGLNGEPSCTQCHGTYWTSAECGTSTHTVSLGGVPHKPNYCRPYQNCAGCHGANLRGGAGGQPSCLQCHTQKNWQNCGPTRHNVSLSGRMHAMNNRSPLSDCSPCHGADLHGGPNHEPSCYQCHGEVWNGSAAGHTSVLGGVGHRPEYCLPYQNCTSCHGANLRGGTSGQPSCLSCHTQRNWQNCGATQHNISRSGILHAGGTVTAVCVNCHGSDLRGGLNNEPSCYQCHGAVWIGGASGHTSVLGGVSHRPEYCLPYQNCTSCHGANLRGGTSGQPSCLSCHTQRKWQNCGSTQHTINRDGHLHAGGSATAVCVLCHGSDLRGGLNSEPSCYSCHGKKW